MLFTKKYKIYNLKQQCKSDSSRFLLFTEPKIVQRERIVQHNNRLGWKHSGI